MKEKKSFGPKQVGERIRERRTELKLSMPELGKLSLIHISEPTRH